jgi:hydrophobic/amphiphilic exporter-1 (mainly G- bacteria), HAE1 family
VMMSLEDRNNPDIVQQLPLAFVQGSPIFLPQVASIERGVGVDKIERRDRQEEVRLTADLLPGVAQANAAADINKWIAKEKLVPEGVRIAPLGQSQAMAREGVFLMSALGIALLLVYMLLASLFDNLLYPFIIQLAQPQAMAGALLALMITDKGLNIVGFVGIIALVGLVGKNAILLVDYTNTLRGRGRNRHDALVEAGPIRLRPIMMTSIAVVLGMLPVALAIGRGSEFRETIGIIIIGGVVLSTLLTLLVIPCSYTIFDDFSNWLGRAMRRQPPEEPGSPEPYDEPSVRVDPEVEPTPVLRYQSEP